MNALDKLIAEKTLIQVVYNDEDIRVLTGIVIDYNIEDFYFYEKRESIYITVNIDPLDDYIEDEDCEIFSNIPLDFIYLA